jgi:hypothetical protein
MLSLKSNLLLLRDERFWICYFATLCCTLFSSCTIYYGIICTVIRTGPDRTGGWTSKRPNQSLHRSGSLKRPFVQSNRYKPVEPAGFSWNRWTGRFQCEPPRFVTLCDGARVLQSCLLCGVLVEWSARATGGPAWLLIMFACAVELLLPRLTFW